MSIAAYNRGSRLVALKAERDALRAENTLLRECNESMRDGMKGLRERLSMPAEGEGEVLQRACEQVDRLTRELAALRQTVAEECAVACETDALTTVGAHYRALCAAACRKVGAK